MDLSNDIFGLKRFSDSLAGQGCVIGIREYCPSGENAELRSRLNLNSGNSHKPPSSDGLKKKPGLPKNPAKKNGAQVGHKGKTLEMVVNPDKEHLPFKRWIST